MFFDLTDYNRRYAFYSLEEVYNRSLPDDELVPSSSSDSNFDLFVYDILVRKFSFDQLSIGN